jgi:hypothetical protein
MIQIQENPPIEKEPKLLDYTCDHKLIRQVHFLKSNSMKSEKAYVHWIKRFILF